MRKALLMAGLLGLSSTAAFADHQFSWNGFYAGAHIGYAWGKASVTDTTGGVTPGPFDYSPRGGFGGGTLGYNFQMQNIVVGLEGDLGYMNLRGYGLVPSSNPAAHQDLTLEGGLYGVASARLGYAWGPTMAYIKGGAAYFDGSAAQTTTNPGYMTTPTRAFSGSVIGGGLEHFVSRDISIKAEYLHFNFGSQGGMQTSISDPPVGFKYLNSTELHADTIKLGVAVHF